MSARLFDRLIRFHIFAFQYPLNANRRKQIDSFQQAVFLIIHMFCLGVECFPAQLNDHLISFAETQHQWIYGYLRYDC